MGIGVVSKLSQFVRSFSKQPVDNPTIEQPAHNLSCFYEPNPAAPWGAVEQGSVPSDALISRIRSAYLNSLAKFTPDSESMWSHIDGARRPVHDALMKDDASAKAILSNPVETALFMGMDNASNIHKPTMNADVEFDTLVRLTESLGLRPAYNPEVLDRHEKISARNARSADEEFSMVCEFVGINLPEIPNPFRGTHGLKLARGILDSKTIQAIYCAHRLNGLGPSKILEIGGGLGRAAYFSYILGCRSFTIVDIPLTSVCQALYLGMTLGEHLIRLEGEPDERQPIHLITTTSLKPQKFDAVLNSDSLTEVGRQTADQYASFIKRNAGWFLSINHEANGFTVRQLFEAEGVYRSSYWLRRGYIEELYSFASS